MILLVSPSVDYWPKWFYHTAYIPTHKNSVNLKRDLFRCYLGKYKHFQCWRKDNLQQINEFRLTDERRVFKVLNEMLKGWIWSWSFSLGDMSSNFITLWNSRIKGCNKLYLAIRVCQYWFFDLQSLKAFYFAPVSKLI